MSAAVASPGLAIETRGLSHVWGAAGVHDLALSVPERAIYGFIGPNGAGKTTSIRLLLGLLRPQQGRVWLQGRDLAAARARALAGVGAMVEAPSLYPHLSAWDNLRVTGVLLGLQARDLQRALEATGLAAVARQKVGTFSLGMQQRLGIALALCTQPRLLILDEPANGLDPSGIAEMRDMLRRFVDELGMTVFLSSHLLGEIEHVATHVGILDGGRLRFQGSIGELQARARPQLYIATAAVEQACRVLAESGEQDVAPAAGGVIVSDAAMPAAEINRRLVEAGVPVSGLRSERAGLEALYFDMTAARSDRSTCSEHGEAA